MNTEATLIIFVIVAALGLVTVVGVEVLNITQEAGAVGCPVTRPRANASERRCVHGIDISTLLHFSSYFSVSKEIHERATVETRHNLRISLCNVSLSESENYD